MKYVCKERVEEMEGTQCDGEAFLITLTSDMLFATCARCGAVYTVHGIDRSLRREREGVRVGNGE